MIGWASLGIVQYAAHFLGHGSPVLLDLPLLLRLGACVCLLVGAVIADTLDRQTTLLTIGGGALGLYAVLRILTGRLGMGGNYPFVMLGVAQEVWFPIAVIVLKARFTGPAGPTPLTGFGSTWHLLLAAQAPGAAGMIILLAEMMNLGAGLLIVMPLSIGGSLLSAALSAAFVRSSHGKLAGCLALGHVAFVVALLAVGAVLMATIKLNYPSGRYLRSAGMGYQEDGMTAARWARIRGHGRRLVSEVFLLPGVMPCWRHRFPALHGRAG